MRGKRRRVPKFSRSVMGNNPIPAIPPSQSTLQHLKSDYVHDVIELDVFEHAVALALRGCGYQESIAKANVLCDVWADPATLYELGLTRLVAPPKPSDSRRSVLAAS